MAGYAASARIRSGTPQFIAATMTIGRAQLTFFVFDPDSWR